MYGIASDVIIKNTNTMRWILLVEKRIEKRFQKVYCWFPDHRAATRASLSAGSQRGIARTTSPTSLRPPLHPDRPHPDQVVVRRMGLSHQRTATLARAQNAVNATHKMELKMHPQDIKHKIASARKCGSEIMSGNI